MSGLAGFLNLHGRPADPLLLDRLLASLAYRAHDGAAGVVDGPAGLGLASFITVPKADAATRPVTHVSAGLTITFDGRIDNRDELIDALGTPPDRTDAGLALAAFERWERDAFVRLLGDFALVIWDARRQQLWLARDIHGVRPLYYRRLPDVVMWASDLQTHVRWRSAGVNEGFVAELLSDRVRHREETIYAGVMRLPAGHAARVTAAGEWSSWRYWMPDPERTIHYRDHREYGEHFRSVLATAVQARTRTPDGATGLFFSGGVESTVLALELARMPGARPLLLTMCAEGTSADEGPMARQAAQELGLPQVALPVYRAVRADYEDDARASLELPALAMLSIGRPLEAEARRRSLRVALGGYGHEEWFFGHELAAADCIASGDIGGLCRALAHRRRMRDGFSASQTLVLGVWLQLSESTRQRYRTILRRTIVRPWIDSAFARRVALEHRLRNEVETPPFRSVAKALTWQFAMGGAHVLGIEQEQRALTAAAIDQRMPFLDRRLVELGLAIPENVLCSDFQPRRVAFLAYDDPALGRLRGRNEGHDFAFMAAEGVVAMGPGFLDELLEGPVGAWVHPDTVRRMWRIAEGAVGNPLAHVGRYAFPLTSMMLVHFWLRALNGHAGSSPRVSDEVQ